MTQSLLNPEGNRVGVLENGYSVPMAWRVGPVPSWKCEVQWRYEGIFGRGPEWTVYTKLDYSYAHSVLQRAKAQIDTLADNNLWVKRAIALEARANELGLDSLSQQARAA